MDRICRTVTDFSSKAVKIENAQTMPQTKTETQPLHPESGGRAQEVQSTGLVRTKFTEHGVQTASDTPNNHISDICAEDTKSEQLT